MHNIDLKKYELRTDLAIDLTEKQKEKYKPTSYINNDVKITWIKLDENNNINKKPGNYLTLEFNDVTDDDNMKKVSNVFKEEFNNMLKKINYNKNMKTTVVGLGNIKSTPDSLGPLVLEDIIVTKHFFDMEIDVDEKFSNVSAFSPGVTGITGIETSDYIMGVLEKTNTDLLIVIDALSSTSISRVNRSIQVSDVGIFPGSGIGNKRKEISSNVLGIPVIVIGVPTVVDAALIVSDTINYMLKNYVYNRKFKTKKSSKFINKQMNYLKEDIDVSNEDKKTLLGIIGMLSEDELKDLMYEVLTPIGYNLMVTPKEEDFLIQKLSKIISYGINHNIHNV